MHAIAIRFLISCSLDPVFWRLRNLNDLEGRWVFVRVKSKLRARRICRTKGLDSIPRVSTVWLVNGKLVYKCIKMVWSKNALLYCRFLQAISREKSSVLPRHFDVLTQFVVSVVVTRRQSEWDTPKVTTVSWTTWHDLRHKSQCYERSAALQAYCPSWQQRYSDY